MFSSTIPTRNIVRQCLYKLGITPLKHSYTEKTSKYLPFRRSVVFKISRSTDIETQRKIASTINSEFLQLNLYNKTTVTYKSYSPYIYVRTIAYI